MLLTESLLIRMNYKHIGKYRQRGYICKVGQDIDVRIEDVNLNSHSKVLAKCDVCDKVREIKYQLYNVSLNNGGYYTCSNKCSKLKYKKTCLKKYGVDNVAKTAAVRNKTEQTCLKKYGVTAPSKNKDVLMKGKATCLEKYGCENAFQSEEINNKIIRKKIENGTQLDNSLKSDFQKYKTSVRRVTKGNVDELFANWNGYDYYDNEYIKEYSNLHYNDRLYPTIDHKISVYHGFKNKISPEMIGDISNLCITKRYINSSKNTKIEY